MKDRLSKKDKVFVKEVIETGNKTQSAKKAYGYKNNNTAGVMALDKLRNPKIQEAIKSIADSIPDELLIEKHLALLNKKDNMYSDQIDSTAVARGLDMGYKLKGSYAPEKKSIEIDEELLAAVKNRVGNILE